MFVKEEIIEVVNKAEKEVKEEFEKIEKIEEYNSLKVLEAFQNNNLSEVHFNETTGYGYDDIGREAIEKIYSEIFGTEDSLVRGQFISASHALAVYSAFPLSENFSLSALNPLKSSSVL